MNWFQCFYFFSKRFSDCLLYFSSVKKLFFCEILWFALYVFCVWNSELNSVCKWRLEMSYNSERNLMILFFLTEFFSDDCACCFNLMCHAAFLHFFQHLRNNWVQMKIQKKDVCFSFHCKKWNNFINVDDLLKICILLLFQFYCDFNSDWFQWWERLLMRLISCYNFVDENWSYHCCVHLLNLNQKKVSNKFYNFKQCVNLIFCFLHDSVQMTVSIELWIESDSEYSCELFWFFLNAFQL